MPRPTNAPRIVDIWIRGGSVVEKSIVELRALFDESGLWDELALSAAKVHAVSDRYSWIEFDLLFQLFPGLGDIFLIACQFKIVDVN